MRRHTHGFTLIELVMTITLMALIATLTSTLVGNNADALKYEETRRKLEAIKTALFGDNSLNNDGHRNSFGYVGDRGSLPAALSNLTTAQAPAWAYDTTYGVGTGWKSAYVSSALSGVDPLVDGWGRAFLYNSGASPPNITSYGADGAAGGTKFNQDIVLNLPDTAWKGSVYGSVSNGLTPVSAATVEIRYPVAGVLTAFTTNTALDGSFSFSNVPFGIRAISVTSTAPAIGPKQVVVDSSKFQLAPNTLVTTDASLVIELDAAKGNGAGFPGAGCATTTWTDLSGNLRNGTLTNFAACGASSGWNGTGVAADPYRLTFDGSNDYVLLPDDIIHAYSTETIEFWFATTVNGVLLGYQNTVYPAVPGNWVPILYVGSNNTLHGQVWNGAVNPIQSGNVADGNWRYAALVVDAGGQNLYINDTLIGNRAGAATHLGMANNQIGENWTNSWPDGNGNFYFYNGSIAYFAVYSRALTLAEIQTHCNALSSRFAGLVCN